MRAEAVELTQYLDVEMSGIISEQVAQAGGSSLDGSTRHTMVEERETLLRLALDKALQNYPDQTARPVNFFVQLDKLSQAWLTATPSPLTSIPGPLFQQAMAWRFCVPSPALHNLVGQPVGSEGAVMDPYGDSLMCAKLPGDTWRTKHDVIKMTLANFCHEARLPIDIEVYGTFAPHIPVAALDENGDLHHFRDRQGLVPDFMFKLPLTNGPPSDTLADVKGLNAGKTWYQNRDKQVNVRSRLVDSEYRRALRKIDQKYNLSEEGETGPLQAILASFGRVQGLVFGVLGEVSEDVHNLLSHISNARATYLSRM